MKTQVCTKCNKSLPLDSFYARATKPSTQCKECEKKAGRARTPQKRARRAAEEARQQLESMARRRALHRLLDRHAHEMGELITDERRRLGLIPPRKKVAA